MPTAKGRTGTPLTAPETVAVRFLVTVRRLLVPSMPTM